MDKPTLIRRLFFCGVDRRFFLNYGLEQKLGLSGKRDEAKPFQSEVTAKLVQRILSGTLQLPSSALSIEKR